VRAGWDLLNAWFCRCVENQPGSKLEFESSVYSHGRPFPFIHHVSIQTARACKRGFHTVYFCVLLSCLPSSMVLWSLNAGCWMFIFCECSCLKLYLNSSFAWTRFSFHIMLTFFVHFPQGTSSAHLSYFVHYRAQKHCQDSILRLWLSFVFHVVRAKDGLAASSVVDTIAIYALVRDGALSCAPARLWDIQLMMSTD